MLLQQQWFSTAVVQHDVELVQTIHRNACAMQMTEVVLTSSLIGSDQLESSAAVL